MANEPQFESKCWFVFACFLVASGTLADAPVARAHDHASRGRFRTAPCPDVLQESIDSFGLTGVECGFVRVPESYRRSCTREPVEWTGDYHRCSGTPRERK